MDKVDNIVDANGAKWFLRALGLHVPESVIMKAVAALRSDASETLYNLYARGMDKVGKERVPICGKSTAYKIKKLYENGQLGPYLLYLTRAFPGQSATFVDSAAGIPVRQSDSGSPLLLISEPNTGLWDYLAGPASALFITLSVRAVSQVEPQCWASVSVEDPPGDSFPLHWAGVPFDIAETAPVYTTITPDIPARLEEVLTYQD